MRDRTPIARHGRLRSPHPVSQVVSMVAVAVLVGIAAVTGVVGFHVWDAATAIRDNAVDIGGDDAALPPGIGEIEGGVNLLLVGTDSCEGQDLALFPRCGIDDDGGERNDVTMLVHISDEPRRVTVVSIPRDTYVEVPECEDDEGRTRGGGIEKINASYMHGGLACSVATVEALTGEEIQFAAAIRWTGVINLSDAVGGVDVCVQGDISDRHTGLALSAGTHTLQGVQALQFLRIRHGIGDGSDLGRISNQQQFMSALVRKLQSDAVFGDPATLLGFASTALQQVRDKQLVLDTRLANPNLMVQIAMALKDVPFEDIVFVQYPTYYSGDGLRPITDAADALFAALRENRPLQLTGDASGGFGVEVTGEAPPATPPTETVPEDAAPAEDAVPEETAPDAAVPSDEAVALPSQIPGQTAAQVTCTVPEG
ncbi:LCP family protein [Microbacterium sp. 18062]|uniref:LCP family protein n=1 Tax=Microbacterium sp. 18062 TaxID=2681410 RepID=UPI00190FA7FE|nr:LCP family protein [Microbacterium sp. 18062]